MFIIKCTYYSVVCAIFTWKDKAVKKRKPCQVPLEEDIKLLHRRLKLLTDDYAFPSSHTFLELRNLVLTRLTLLNARQGGETERLQRDEWLEVEQGGWIDKQRLANLSPVNKMLAKTMKTAYQTGKGSKHIEKNFQILLFKKLLILVNQIHLYLLVRKCQS